MRRVDDDEPGLRRDRGVDRGKVEVEARRCKLHLPRHGVGGEQCRLVAEPGRLGDDRLVAGVEQQAEGDGDRGEGAGGQGKILGIEGEAQLAADALGEEGAGLLLAGLVGEPVLVVRDRRFAECCDDAGQRHFLRVAEGEVGDARREAPLGIAGPEIEIGDRREGRLRRAHAPRHLGHGGPRSMEVIGYRAKCDGRPVTLGHSLPPHDEGDEGGLSGSASSRRRNPSGIASGSVRVSKPCM